jgi:hypothetical protein
MHTLCCKPTTTNQRFAMHFMHFIEKSLQFFLPNADFADSQTFRKVCTCLPPNVLQTNWNIPAVSVSQTVSVPADIVQFAIYIPTKFKIGERWGCRPRHRACKKTIILSKMTEFFSIHRENYGHKMAIICLAAHNHLRCCG